MVWILVLLRAFHLEMSFFGALGTFINESGGDHLLVEAGVLAGGSHMGFHKGSFYNRCTRIHEINASAFENLIRKICFSA